MRIDRHDSMRFYELFAVLTALTNAANDAQFVRRVRSVHGGWRDLRLIQTTAERLIDGLLKTLPVEKLTGFQRVLHRMKFQVMLGPLAEKPRDDGKEVITSEELDALIRAAWGYRCRLCGESCARCELGKALDALLPWDRDGGHWGDIDIERDPEKGAKA